MRISRSILIGLIAFATTAAMIAGTAPALFA